MKREHFHLFENKWYWFASIVAMLTMAPTDLHQMAWYCIIAVLCLTAVFSRIKLCPKYIITCFQENKKQSILLVLFSVFHAVAISRSFYLMWIPSNKLSDLASRFHLDSSKLLWIIILVAAPCIICSLFVLLSYLMDQYQKGNISEYVVILFFALLVFQASQAISCGLVSCSPVPKYMLFGTLIVVAMIAFVDSIAANIKVSVPVGTLPFMLLSTVNYYVFQFRGRELGPQDILSFGTAMNVVDGYKFTLSRFVAMGWLEWVLLLAVLFLTKREPVYKKKRLISGAICLLSVLVVFAFAKDTPVRSWANSGSAINGTVLNFAAQIRDSRVKTPEGYTLDTLRELEQQYRMDDSAPSDRQPSIIVIMDESFTDFSVLGNAVQAKEPLLPFVSSMKENTIQGYAYSSIYGGGTANSEFEFLTGDSMAFLPYGSTPYQQFLSENQFSLLSYLHSVGYYCIATHPYYANGWNRPNVYDWFGFDETSFLPEYPQNDIVRKYVSDREMFDYIIREYENRDVSRNFFLFGVTVQNHGGYTFSDFESTVTLEYNKHYPEAEQYLSLANLSDQAVEYLIDSFSEEEDPVVICFFGDHQPRVEAAFLEEVHGGPFNDLNSVMLEYKVPFFIWANFDIEEQQNVETSINYLSTYLLEACGMELPAYNQFLREVNESIPVISADGYYSLSSEQFLPISDAVGEEKAILDKYAILEYNNLFDKENISSLFLFE